MSVPLWLPDVLRGDRMSDHAAGLLASGQLAAAAIMIVLSALLLKRFSPRLIVRGAGLLAALGYGGAALDALPLFVAGILLAGAAAGSCLPIVNGVAARSGYATRIFPLLVTIQVAFGMAFYATVPALQQWAGPWVIFAVLAGLGVINLLTAGWLPEAARVETGPAAKVSGITSGEIAALAGLTLLFMGHESIISFAVILGEGHGMSRELVGSVLSAMMASAILAPAAGAWLSRGRDFAILIAVIMAVSASVMIVLGAAPDWLLFSACVLFLNFCTTLLVPLFYCRLAELNPHGSAGAMAPACLIVGASAGPTIGVLAGAGTAPLRLASVAAACLLAGALAQVLARVRRPPSAT
ncbi:MAG TPA: hypothetical protein VMG08_14890 [Allosphingosinicella sp.]|nr:hypothetical protein [Allosphingosinicella sp.]